VDNLKFFEMIKKIGIEKKSMMLGQKYIAKEEYSLYLCIVSS
jgi:hypothetical protein